METPELRVSGHAARSTRRAHVGVVGSGDLEVLLEPIRPSRTRPGPGADQRRRLWPGLEGGARPLLRPLRAAPRTSRSTTSARRPGRDACGSSKPPKQSAVMMQRTSSADPITEERRRSWRGRASSSCARASAARALLDPGHASASCSAPSIGSNRPGCRCRASCPQSDDGVVVARGQLDGRARRGPGDRGGLPGRQHGRSLRQPRSPARWSSRGATASSGKPILPVLLLETGGVRLQEANLGVAAVAEIHAAIVALRRHVPVIGVITGMVGCFGGMSIAAGLCSYLVVVPQARLGLNGPEVIEQEAGIDELDAGDQRLIWSLIGGEQRYDTGFADALVEDDADALRQTVRDLRGAWRSRPASQRAGRRVPGAAWRTIDPAAPPDGPALRADLAERRDAHEQP